MSEILNTWQELLFLIAAWKIRFSLVQQSRLHRRRWLDWLWPLEAGTAVTVSSQKARYITKFDQIYLMEQDCCKAVSLLVDHDPTCFRLNSTNTARNPYSSGGSSNRVAVITTGSTRETIAQFPESDQSSTYLPWIKPKSTTGKPSQKRWQRVETLKAGFISARKPLLMGSRTRCQTSLN